MTLVRNITVQDASSFLALTRQLDEETKFMLLEPGERKVTLEQQEQQIIDLLDSQAFFIYRYRHIAAV